MTMKKTWLNMLGLCCAAFAMTAGAADVAAPTPAPTAVAAAAHKATLINGKVNPNAQVYFYLQSASWCGPCRMAMPGVVEAHQEMRADGRAEVILVNYDASADEGKAYIASYLTDMPSVHYCDRNVDALPGFTRSGGDPFGIVVDAEGNVLDKGAPTRIEQWKKYVK